MNQKKSWAVRIFMTPLANGRLSAWLQQVKQSEPLVKINKSDLVNFILEGLPTTISPNMMASIRKKYFDPLKSINSLVSKIKQAKEAGEVIAIEKLIEETFRPKAKTTHQTTNTGV